MGQIIPLDQDAKVPSNKRKWKIVYEVGINPSTGKRKRKAERFIGTETAAHARLIQLEAQVINGEFRDYSKQTLEEWLLRWVDNIAKPDLKPVTYEGYRFYITKHINPIIGKIPLNVLTPLHIKEFYAFKSQF